MSRSLRLNSCFNYIMVLVHVFTSASQVETVLSPTARWLEDVMAFAQAPKGLVHWANLEVCITAVAIAGAITRHDIMKRCRTRYDAYRLSHC